MPLPGPGFTHVEEFGVRTLERSEDGNRHGHVVTLSVTPNSELRTPNVRTTFEEWGPMAVQEWECVSSEIVGDHDVFKVRRSIMRSPRTGDEHEFHMLDVPTCVKVIPVTEDGHIVLVEQYRQAVQRASLEFPAGVMEDGEDAITAGMRELEEETGYRAKRATVVGEFDPDPAIQANAIKLVVARDCTPDGRKDQDEGEDVQVRVVTPEEVRRLIRNGTIRHAAAISAWYLYESMSGES